MRISPLNYSCGNYAKFNRQNFKGLWGKTSTTTDFDAGLSVANVTTSFYYYPFKNESDEEIKQVIKDNSSAYIEEKNGHSRYKINDCKRCLTLPFTEDEYNSYASLGKKTKLTREIIELHKSVQDKYLTKDYGNNQIPAANYIIYEKIKNKDY